MMAPPLRQDETGQLGHICARQYLSLPVTAMVIDALNLMMEHRQSCVVVLNDGCHRGIVTESDSIRLARDGIDLRATALGEVLVESRLLSVEASMDYREAYELMSRHRVRCMLVEAPNGSLLGVVTETHLLRRMGVEYFLEYKSLADIMTRHVITLTPADSLAEALDIMARSHISCVVVVESGVPVGMLSERDAVRCLALGVEPASSSLRGLMSSPVHSLNASTGVHLAVATMKELDIRRLVVVDDQRQLQGLVTVNDIVRGIQGRYVDLLKSVIARQANDLNEVRRRLAEKHLLDDLLYASSEIAIVATDLNYRVSFWNQRAEDCLGPRESAVLGRPLSTILSECGLDDGVFQVGSRLVPGIDAHRYPIALTREGLTRYFDVRVMGAWDSGRQLAGFVLTLRDITSEQNAVKALRESEEWLRAIFRNAAAGMAALDLPGGRIHRVNPELCRMTGYSEDELLTMSFRELLEAGERERFDATLQDSHQGAITECQVEHRCRTRSGPVNWLLISIGVVRDEQGQAVSAVLLLQDISEQRRAEQRRLAMAEQQRDTLIREVHHRIKNHLQGVIGLLRMHLSANQAHHEVLGAAVRQVETVAIVHGLLGRSEHSRLDLGDMVESIAKMVESLTHARIRRILPVALPVIQLLEDKAVALALVINELLVNAAKHSAGDHPEVTIEMQLQGEAVLLLVCNSGKLPVGFQYGVGDGLGTGLELVRSMLPRRAARLDISNRHGEEVCAQLQLLPPLVAQLAKAATAEAPAALKKQLILNEEQIKHLKEASILP